MGHRGGTTRRATIVVSTFVIEACGGSRTRAPTPLADHGCTVVPSPAATPESASVVLTSPIDPANAPRATTVGERFVFAHVYETLVRVDCSRRPLAGLAKSWGPLDGNTRWRVVLRSDARFWNGDAVRASDVIASWRATGRIASAALARRFADATTIVDDTTLGIAVSGVVPTTLGDPELAVVRRTGPTPWPEGTGPYRIAMRGSTLVLEPAAGANSPRLVIHSVAEADARDLIDAGVDLMLTDSPTLAAYAANRGDVGSVPLAWHRTWVIVSPQRAPLGGESRATLDTVMARTLAFRVGLARDVVRSDARPAERPFWWSDAASCSTQPATDAPVARSSSRVAYPRDEPIARALAERLVALAATSRRDQPDSALTLLASTLAEAGSRATAVGLAPNALASALRDGSELAFVLPLDRASLRNCFDMRGAIAPLIDTRLTAVVRRDRLGLTLAWDSTVTVSPGRP